MCMRAVNVWQMTNERHVTARKLQMCFSEAASASASENPSSTNVV